MNTEPFLLGAVAYDPKVVTIWEGFKAYFIKHGLPFPVITNSGPKGPAIKHLSGRTSGQKVFVDDSPNFVKSSFEFAPEVKIVHFLHDERFVKMHQPFDFVSHTTGDWDDAKRHIHGLIG